jgi:hypothetical protein
LNGIFDIQSVSPLFAVGLATFDPRADIFTKFLEELQTISVRLQRTTLLGRKGSRVR